MNDAEVRDIYDDYTFKSNAIERAVSKENTYHANNSEGRLDLEAGRFHSAVPKGEFYTEKLKERAKAANLAELEHLARLDPAAAAALRTLPESAWEPGTSQPKLYCFLCRTRMDRKLKAPLLMACGHTVCKECVIDRESQELPIICCYDNTVVKGVHALVTDTVTMAMILKEEQALLDAQI